jgi:hypothetical protein
MIIALFALLSFGIAIKLIGLLGLAYIKKEGLGKVHKITAYITIACGTIVFVGGIIAAIVMSTIHGSHCHDGKSQCQEKNMCHMKMKSDCGGGSCGSSYHGSSHHGKSHHGSSDYSSSCDHMGMKIIKKKIIRDGEEGEDINVEVKVIEE